MHLEEEKSEAFVYVEMPEHPALKLFCLNTPVHRRQTINQNRVICYKCRRLKAPALLCLHILWPGRKLKNGACNNTLPPYLTKSRYNLIALTMLYVWVYSKGVGIMILSANIVHGSQHLRVIYRQLTFRWAPLGYGILYLHPALWILIDPWTFLSVMIAYWYKW